MINVEFPINEKYRKYLKIEYLFNQYHFFIKQKHSDHITNILFQLLFKLNTNAARADIKVELINDLQRILTKYKTHVDEASKLKKSLEKINSFSPFALNNNKMIQELRVRSESPQGINDIDFSKYKIWTELQNTKSRNLFFKDLFKDLFIINESLSFILKILRKHSIKESLTANNMVAQLKLDPLVKFDLLTINLKSNSIYEPSISANKYAININFTHPVDDKKTKRMIKFSVSLHSL